MVQDERRRPERRPSGLAACLTAATGGLLFALTLLSPATAGGLVGARAAAKAYTSGPAATAATLERSAAGAKIIFDLNMMVEASAYVLTDPDRVIVDLPETAFLISPTVGRPTPARGRKDEPGLVSSFRFGHFAPGRSRIVIDLSSPARVVKAAAERTESGGAARLVVELASSDAESFRAAARAARAAHLQAAPPTPAASPAPAAPQLQAAARLPVVVLDAGHGGIDIGAVGGREGYEKAIVLDFVRQLGAKLEQGGRVKPVLTRAGDVFVPLGDRVKIARDARASLFVSVHADTLNETSVHGATVYTLSDRASDAEAARVAAKENGADHAGGTPEPEEVVDVNDILFDLTRRETRAMSHVFAQGLVAAWRFAGDLNKNPVRSAGFVVLKAPDVPSVLLELGYLSSDKDAANLTSPDWREKAATRVAQAVERYFASRLEGDPTVSVQRSAAAGVGDAVRP